MIAFGSPGKLHSERSRDENAIESAEYFGHDPASLRLVPAVSWDDVQVWGGTAFPWSDEQGTPTGGESRYGRLRPDGDQFEPNSRVYD